MKAREFHSLADELATTPGAAQARSAISRAYYAAFHAGAQTLRSLGIAIGKGAAAHGEVAHCLANSQDVEVCNAAHLLGNLHKARIRADYQLDRIDVEQASNARGIVNDARSVIDAFEKILTGARRPHIQAAIAAWRKSNGYP